MIASSKTFAGLSVGIVFRGPCVWSTFESEKMWTKRGKNDYKKNGVCQA